MQAETNVNKIYLLSSTKDYQQAMEGGSLYRDSLDSEGFIHASPKNQLTRVANKYYKKVIKPLVLVLDLELIEPEVKWEKAAGSLYPHIYGPLNINSVIQTVPIAINMNNSFDINL